MKRDRCWYRLTATLHLAGRALSGAPTGSQVLVGLVVMACSAPIARDADVVVAIDGEVLRHGDYETFLAANAKDESPLADSVQSRLFDMFIEQRLLVAFARSKGVDEPTALAATDALLALESRSAISEAEIRAYYDAHVSDFERPEEAHVRQILVEDRVAGDRALAALSAGEDFAEVAARLSVGPNSHHGGDQGVLARNDLPDPFAEVIFDLEVGDVSEMVPADYGHHIFQVLEHHETRLVPLEEVAREIGQRLFQQRADALVEEFIADAKERYNVEVFAHNLPFEYQGSFVDENDQQQL